MTSSGVHAPVDAYPWLRWTTVWAVVGVLALFVPVQLEIWTAGMEVTGPTFRWVYWSADRVPAATTIGVVSGLAAVPLLLVGARSRVAALSGDVAAVVALTACGTAWTGLPDGGPAGAVLCGCAAVLAVGDALLPIDRQRAVPASAVPATRAVLVAVLLGAIVLLLSVPDNSLNPDWWRYVGPVDLLGNPLAVTSSFMAAAVASFWLRVRSAAMARTLAGLLVMWGALILLQGLYALLHMSLAAGGEQADPGWLYGLQPTVCGVGFLAAAVAVARRRWPLAAATLSTTFAAVTLAVLRDPSGGLIFI